MHPAMQGGLIGLAAMVVLIGVEYYFVKKQVADRASPTNPKPQFEATDRNRVKSVVNFSIFLPPAFAVGAWLIDQFK